MTDRLKTLLSKLNSRRLIRLSLAGFAIALFFLFLYTRNRVEPTFTDTPTGSSDESAADKEAEEESDDHILTICIDAGHGGKDRGSDSKGRIEKHDCLKLAKAIEIEFLQRKDRELQVILTRDDDSSLSLAERCSIANEQNADYMISIHRNKGKGNGTELWISKNASAESMAMAQSIMNGLNEVGISRDRGIKTGSQSSRNEDYYVNHHSRMPSCLIELGFVNSSEDNALFDRNLEAYAKAIVDSVLSTYDLFHTDNPQQAYLKEHNIDDVNDIIPTVTLADTTADTNEASSVSGVPEDSNTGSASGASGPINNEVSGNSDPDRRKRIALFGVKQRTTHIPAEEVDQLDDAEIEFMQGGQTADRNRPVVCLENETAYKKYNAHFIGTDLMSEEGKKILYLTYNMRYEYGYTEKLLDVLQEYDCKATFFVTLDYVHNNPTLIRRMLNEGHVIGNLSSTNPKGGVPHLEPDRQKHEILAAHTFMKKYYNYSMYLFRFPAGIYSEKSMAIVNNMNYQSIFWSFAYADYDTGNQPDPEDSLTKFISRLHPGGIYMLRGESETNSAIIEDFIQKALALGYEFCLLEAN